MFYRIYTIDGQLLLEPHVGQDAFTAPSTHIFLSIILLLRSAFSACPQDPGLSRHQGMVTNQQPPAVETSAQALLAGGSGYSPYNLRGLSLIILCFESSLMSVRCRNCAMASTSDDVSVCP